MALGKQIRLNRLFAHPSGRLCSIAVDHTYPRRFHPDGKVEIVYEPEEIAWAVRCGIEVGGDVIKVPYCGDVASYTEIVRSCPVPVVAAGGPKAATLKDALRMAEAVIQSGARGMTIGRNVWGTPRIGEAIAAFKAVIHGLGTGS